jgi:hypothetical protein
MWWSLLLERVFAAVASGWRANCEVIEPLKREALALPDLCWVPMYYHQASPTNTILRVWDVVAGCVQ